MMGVLSRFKDVMKVNINALLERTEDPEKAIDTYMRSLNSDLGTVKAETASVQADERRSKRALDECQAEIKKLQRYAEKSVEAGDEDAARKFLEKKAVQAEKLTDLQTEYEAAAANADKMKQMQDKLESDMNKLEARYTEIKGKMAAAKTQQELNSGGSSISGANAAFNTLEEKASRALYEAEALAELRAGAKEDDLDDLMAELEKNMEKNGAAQPKATRAEDELAAIKEKLKQKE
ncbi:phage-shock protein [Paenibacillus solani]|uniref:Phage-shock protein n=2 Tax=Paenibacillus solani TaxID=1705565 RepID=A0A0M1N3T1_9BACL|nr:phage-shock protein [Paenibacillus solani]